MHYYNSTCILLMRYVNNTKQAAANAALRKIVLFPTR
jgi:hypothetical protein